MLVTEADSPALVEKHLRARLCRHLKKVGKSIDVGLKLMGDTEPEYVCRRA